MDISTLKNKLMKISTQDIKWETRRGNRMICFHEEVVKYTDVSPSALFYNTADLQFSELVRALTPIAESTFTYGFSVKFVKVPNKQDETDAIRYRFVLDWDIFNCPSDFVSYAIRCPQKDCVDSSQYWTHLYGVWDSLVGYTELHNEFKQ